eukprot:3895817-Amphidinium_carterae.4
MNVSIRDKLNNLGFPLEETSDRRNHECVRRLGTAIWLCDNGDNLNTQIKKRLGNMTNINVRKLIHRHARDERSMWQDPANRSLSGGSLPRRALVGMVKAEIQRLPNGKHVVFEKWPTNDIGVSVWRHCIENAVDEVQLTRAADPIGDDQIGSQGSALEQLCIERGCVRVEQNLDLQDLMKDVGKNIHDCSKIESIESTCLCMDRDCECCREAFLTFELPSEDHATCVVCDEEDEHRNINGENVPLWGLITRQIHPNEPEYHSDACQKAMLNELEKLHQKNVWDHSSVMEYGSLMSDPNKAEVMIGRVFGIMGEKFCEENNEKKQYKGRIVFQGSNITTKTGNSPVELFAELANSPTTFTSAIERLSGLASLLVVRLVFVM